LSSTKEKKNQKAKYFVNLLKKVTEHLFWKRSGDYNSCSECKWSDSSI